jgi:anaerobic ribonucleoside-triphosphate reductase activating protein
MHFLSDRYSPADPCFTMPNTLEIRVRGTEITVNGFPAADARGLWKGWRRRG